MDPRIGLGVAGIAAAYPLDGACRVDGNWPADASRSQLCACVPACNERRLIARCLDALDRALEDGDGVVLLANGCTDATADIALGVMRGWRRPWLLVACDWQVGGGSAPLARRLAMEVAHFLAPDAALLSTDGDTVAAPGLGLAYRAAFARGGDLVCGAIDFLPEEAAVLPPMDAEGEFLLREYRAVSREIAQMLMPDPDNVWPHHGNIGGANFAVSAPAYRTVGGLPTPPSGEDRALRRAVAGHGLRILYVETARVMTSPRLDGRARGGLSDELRRSRTDADPIVDEALEPPATLFRRVSCLRDYLRAEDAAGRAGVLAALGLGIADRQRLARSGGRAAFHQAEDASPVLSRRPMRLSDLRHFLPGLLALRDSIAGDRAGSALHPGGPRDGAPARTGR